MKLTIVLTIFNKEPFLRKALDAILNQEYVSHNDYELLALYQEVVATIKEVEMSNDINTLELNA